jgi:hypothetical protein
MVGPSLVALAPQFKMVSLAFCKIFQVFCKIFLSFFCKNFSKFFFPGFGALFALAVPMVVV